MGYVRNNYGCHCFYGDSAFKRYNRAHCGDTVIFNYNSGNTYNACCGGHGGGGFWSGIGMGLGMGLGNLFGGLFGDMFGGGFGNMFGGNMFGGFGFPSFGGGFGNWGGGLWGLGGTPAGAGKAGTTTVSNSDSPDKDYSKLNDYHEEANKLVKGIQDGTIKDPKKAVADFNKKLDDYAKSDKIHTPENDKQIENLKQQANDALKAKDADTEQLAKFNKEIDGIETGLKNGTIKPDDKVVADLLKAIEEKCKTPHDDIEKDNNKINYKGALDRLNGIIDNAKNQSSPSQPVASDEAADDANSTPARKIKSDLSAGINLPKGYTKVESAAGLTAAKLKMAHDTSDKTTDVVSRNGAEIISDHVYYDQAAKKRTDFPVQLKIKDNNGTYTYRCIGIVGGQAIYATPETDANGNEYVLCKRGDDFILLQTNQFSGHGKGDTQCK